MNFQVLMNVADASHQLNALEGQIKMRVTPKHIRSFADTLGRTGFHHLQILQLFKLRYGDAIVSDQNLLLAMTPRQAWVQKKYREMYGIPRNEAVDHIANSALLKVIYLYAKQRATVKLYNIVYFIFIFNSCMNLTRNANNAEDAVHELHTRRLMDFASRYLEEKAQHGWKNFRQFIAAEGVEHSAAYVNYVRTKLRPQLLRLYPLLKVSSSVIGMLRWLFELLDPDQPLWTQEQTQFTNLKATIARNADIDAVRAYFDDSPRRRELYPAFFYYDSATFDRETIAVEQNPLHVKLFLVLYFARNQESQRLLQLFEDSDDEED